jgi:3',5'-cyclic AMP phosphodiesterase CpdA
MINFLKRKWILISLAIFLLALGTYFVQSKKISPPKKEDKGRIGWITDIHAGANKKRAFVREDGSDNTLYPKKYKEYFPLVLDRMKKEGIRTVVVTGDHTNLTEFHYAEDLKKMADESGIKFIWVRGNHDFLPGREKDTMPVFGVTNYFYHYDTETTRIIVLDINFNGPLLTSDNLSWLKERLAETNLPIIIASHTPIINYDSGSFEEAYAELGNIIDSSGKVKFVISGHTHLNRKIEKNGILYQTAWPLTQKDHMGSYYSININEDEIDHFENYQ